MTPTAIVGAVTASTVDATRREDQGRIDLGRAREQHAAYVAALETLGYTIVALPGDEANPDGVFVEDQAVVVGERALVCRSGHPGRRAEADAVEQALITLGLDVVRMPAPATLDGGDVLRLGSTLWVGRSDRTNDAGLAVLAEVFPTCEVRRVVLPNDVLHLKCVCSSPVPGVLVVADGLSAIDLPERVIRVAFEDRWAANVVGRGDQVIVGAGYPRVEAAIRAAGFEVLPVDMSEIRKGDGSLTCLSILIRG